MNTGWSAHFDLLAGYNVWATARLLAAVRALPEDDYRRDVGLFFKSIHGTLNHLLVGEHHLWFVRFAEGISPKVALDAELERDRAQLDARLREGAARWAPLIASFSPERWGGTLDYTTMRGTAASLPFAATLAHVFNHGTHHRGQITAALTALGQPCPELDLVYFLQKPVQAMSSQNLSITQTGAVARITLTQPEVRNAFSDEVIAEITAAFTDVGARPDVRAVVLAAEGPAFCAGANLNWMRRMADYTRDENIADAGKLAEMLRVIYECPKPTVARVQGDVYAGGMGLVAACDMAVAVDTAGFCLSEVKLGLIPATISPYVIRAMGARAAHRYFLTAERFGAFDALRTGFVHEVVAADQLDAKVDELLKALTSASPSAVRACKKLVIDVAEREINAGLIAATVQGIADIRASDEGKEGVQSFLNKRKPNWLG